MNLFFEMVEMVNTRDCKSWQKCNEGSNPSFEAKKTDYKNSAWTFNPLPNYKSTSVVLYCTPNL